MRTPAARVGIAVGALALMVALFVVLSGGDDDGASPATTQPPQAVEGPTGGTTARATQRPKPPILRILVRGGKPVGGVKGMKYESGERVRFLVRSDVAEEVHVHGYDISKDVSAGGSVRFGFPAELEGVFEVELEHSHVQIARLRVEP